MQAAFFTLAQKRSAETRSAPQWKGVHTAEKYPYRVRGRMVAARIVEKDHTTVYFHLVRIYFSRENVERWEEKKTTRCSAKSKNI